MKHEVRAGVSDALTSALLSLSQDSILLIDVEGRVLVASQSAERLFRRVSRDLVGHFVSELIEDVERVASSSAGDPKYSIGVLRVAGGSVLAEIAVAELPDGGLIARAVRLRDVMSSNVAASRQSAEAERYEAFEIQIARFAARADGVDAVLEGTPALIAAALQIKSALLLLIDDRGETRTFGDRITAEMLRVGGVGLAAALADSGADAFPIRFADSAAVERCGFQDAIASRESLAMRRYVVLAAFSREPARFDAPSRDFLKRVGALLRLAIERSERGRA